MANEVNITEMAYAYIRGDVPTPVLLNISQQIDAQATQDNSSAVSSNTQLVRLQTSVETRVAIWDEAGAITASNSHLLAANSIEDFDIQAGQIISSKVV